MQETTYGSKDICRAAIRMSLTNSRQQEDKLKDSYLSHDI